MLYEYRCYEAEPGRLEDLDRRFRDLTVGIFERLGFRQLGFWIPEGSNQLVYLLAWSDRAESEAKWKAFQSDQEWKEGKAVSERAGPLVATVTTQFWSPTAYSASG
jgi:hypothetical protein